MPGFIHRLSIERPTAATNDDYNQPSIDGHPELAATPGLIQPKTAREIALSHDAGAELADFTIYLARQDIKVQDRVRDVTDSPTGPLYEVRGIRDFNYGGLAHLAVDARRIRSDAIEAGGS